MKAKGLGAGTYVRLGSTTRLADPALVLELQRIARGVSFESLPEPRAALEDLDLRMLAGLRQRKAGASGASAEGSAEVSVLAEPELTALGLAVSEGQKTVPTNAGILLACPDPTRFLPSAWVQVGRLRGEGETDIFDQDEIRGPILLAVGKTMEFLKKNAFQSAVFGEVRRRDVYSIPVEAIREVVVNALVHAGYAEQGTPIRVAFYDDRIQVESPGGCCRE